MNFEINDRVFAFFSESRQWEKLLALLKQYLLQPAVIAAFVLIIAGIGLYVYARLKNREKLLKGIRLLAPAVYLFFILSVAVFNRSPMENPPAFRFQPGFILEGDKAFHETRVLMAILDFLYFIPFGMLLKWHREKWKNLPALLIVAATGLTVEVLQAALALGIGTLEHVVIYTLGGLLGILLVDFSRKRKQKKQSPKE